IEAAKRQERVMINREKQCPFLLRVFWSNGSHNRMESFDKVDDSPLSNELHIYTWLDATLGEIAELVQNASPEAQQPNTRMGISIVHPDRRGRYVMRKVGWVFSNRRKSPDEEKTLTSLGFQPGDFLDIALLQ
ncbi:TPA: hypothetical protein N0F65_000290, partial [Lagenidium giganteum]